MFQAEQQSWLEHNFWQLVQFVVLVSTIVASFVTLREGLKTVQRDVARHDTRLEGVEKDVETHCSDKQIHIDTVRDERRLATIERKLDAVLDALNTRSGSGRLRP